MRRARFAVLLSIGLAAAGCGPLSEREYVQRADAICREMDAREAQLRDSLDDIAGYARKGREVVAFDQRARERLGKLRAPNELKDRVRTYLVALDRRLARQRKAVGDAMRGDVGAVLTEELRTEPFNEQEAAARVGFRVCGKS
jgi:hypothetical protein